MKRRTDEEIVAAYEAHGSVWEAGRALGLAGQTVHERLRSLEYPIRASKWTDEEVKRLRELVGTANLSEIARELGRPYAGVAIKISRLGLSHNAASFVRQRKLPRGSGYTKANAHRWAKELKNFKGSLRQFATARGLSVDSIVATLQTHEPDFWRDYSARSGVEPKECVYCTAVFYPMNARQMTCSRKCQGAKRRDEQYFGGRRRDAIGLLEGECQLCLRRVEKGLSAHHILGKENDPDNEFLIALCPGCHQIVGHLAGRKFADDKDAWERLVTLVMSRRLADRDGNFAGVQAVVELEWLTASEVLETEVQVSEIVSNQVRAEEEVSA